MSTFKLVTGNDTFELDGLGTVSQAGALIGAWKTTPDNKILIRKNNGDSIALRVDWKFNANNQLTILSEGKEIYNFHANPALRPYFETRNSVLRVSPSKTNPFTFELRGDWELTSDNNLAFTINGVRSVLDGALSDPLGRFMFYFADKNKPLLKYKLGFVGAWQTAPDRDGALVFQYRREDGTNAEFRLPGSITLQRGTNQLRYEYQKNGTQAIDFAGTLMIGRNFQVSYALNRQLSASGELMVPETTLTFDAVYDNNNGLTGDLKLTLKRPDGKLGSTNLAIQGSYTAVRGTTNLEVGYTFNQVRAGQTITTTFGFAGDLKFRNGGVQWTFNTDNAQTRTLTLSVGGQVQLGTAHLDGKLNLEVSKGHVQGITYLLGVTF
jgi:hypothetical protein